MKEMRTLAHQVELHARKVCPNIIGMVIGRKDDRSTWQPMYDKTMTEKKIKLVKAKMEKAMSVFKVQDALLPQRELDHIKELRKNKIKI